MDWTAEVKKQIVQHFKSIDVVYQPKDHVQDCLVDFLNLDMKLVKPNPRTVFKSKMLSQRDLSPETTAAMDYIIEKIQKGLDITGHLSKQIFDPDKNDFLLNDWLIHHLHLSTTKADKTAKFYDRSKYLLFVGFNSYQAFIIDIRPHKEQNVFAKKELLEIIDNNWPA